MQIIKKDIFNVRYIETYEIFSRKIDDFAEL